MCIRDSHIAVPKVRRMHALICWSALGGGGWIAARYGMTETTYVFHCEALSAGGGGIVMMLAVRSLM
eukprot:1341881-Prorocentrum_lima.AAC.1